jgi:DNA-binding CsgD family transcriptional regulator
VHRDPPPSSARRQLTALLAPLADRLAFDRRAARHALLDDVVEALLEELPQPVFAVAATGQIELANGHARRWLARDREGTLSALRDALAGKPAGVPVRTLRLTAATLVCFELADAEARLDERVDRTAERLQLTQRQRDVLRLVARGCSNATIADRLSICARAVEFHVTAILDRAAVDNRASIISHVLAHD